MPSKNLKSAKKAKTSPKKTAPESKYLSGRIIDPVPIASGIKLVDLIDEHFLAYNAGRIREACHLYTRKMLQNDVVV